jgi:glycine cleavage system H protein
VQQGGFVGFPEDVRYTAEHEWARSERGAITVGITSYATDQLGDVVFVELPEVGKRVEATKPFGVVEAVKTVSDLYAPVGGQIVEVNGALADNPGLVNSAPFADGWMIRIKPDNPGDLQGLMSAEEYERLIEEQHA